MRIRALATSSPPLEWLFLDVSSQKKFEKFSSENIPLYYGRNWGVFLVPRISGNSNKNSENWLHNNHNCVSFLLILHVWDYSFTKNRTPSQVPSCEFSEILIIYWTNVHCCFEHNILWWNSGSTKTTRLTSSQTTKYMFNVNIIVNQLTCYKKVQS